jgi:hypothetical protein
MREYIQGTALTERNTCNELLDDLREYGKSNIKRSTPHVLGCTIPFDLPCVRAVVACSSPSGAPELVGFQAPMVR